MKYLVAVGVCWFLAVLNVSAMPFVKVLDVTPDLLLVFAVCWAVTRGYEEALFVVPAAAVLRDLTTSDPLGLSLLAMAPIVLLALAVQMRAIESQFLPTVVVVAAGSVAYSIISMTVLALTGQSVPWGDALLRVTLPWSVVNALFAPIIYLPVNWLSGRASGGYGSPLRAPSRL
jgi:rod shape-determining protein MreD